MASIVRRDPPPEETRSKHEREKSKRNAALVDAVESGDPLKIMIAQRDLITLTIVTGNLSPTEHVAHQRELRTLCQKIAAMLAAPTTPQQPVISADGPRAGATPADRIAQQRARRDNSRSVS